MTSYFVPVIVRIPINNRSSIILNLVKQIMELDAKSRNTKLNYAYSLS